MVVSATYAWARFVRCRESLTTYNSPQQNGAVSDSMRPPIFAPRAKTTALPLEQTPVDDSGCALEAPAREGLTLDHGQKNIQPMSYDFRLFRRRADEAPNVTAARCSSGFPATPPDQQKESLKRRVAEALIAQHPHLRVCQFSYDKIAQFEQISVEEARRRHRHVEINGPEGGNGIQVILRDDEATVTVPLGHIDQKAADAFREL